MVIHKSTPIYEQSLHWRLSWEGCLPCLMVFIILMPLTND